jgi:peroxiredoxin
MAEAAPVCNFGWKAPDFRLPATDGQVYALSEIKGRSGTLVMFICNHCPYVQAIIDRIVRDAVELKDIGIAAVAISSNDATAYPEDRFARMTEVAEAHSFPFSYLYDESQDVARRYGAVCTPDFFGFNAALELEYRGRLDASGKQAAAPSARRELFEAMRLIAETGRGPLDQIPSLGCSIKWKDA